MHQALACLLRTDQRIMCNVPQMCPRLQLIIRYEWLVPGGAGLPTSLTELRLLHWPPMQQYADASGAQLVLRRSKATLPYCEARTCRSLTDGSSNFTACSCRLECAAGEAVCACKHKCMHLYGAWQREQLQSGRGIWR